MPKAIVPKSANYLSKRLAKENGVKSLDELVKRVKIARDKGHNIVDNTTAPNISFCYYCKRAVVSDESNIYRTKRRNPPEEVLACNRCRSSSVRRANYRKKYGLV
jgi:hypothetical protein